MKVHHVLLRDTVVSKYYSTPDYLPFDNLFVDISKYKAGWHVETKEPPRGKITRRCVDGSGFS